LVVSDVNVSTAAFSVPDTAASVPIGGNLKLPVTFSPAETSDYSDTLRVHTNTDDAPHDAVLSGTGVDVALAVRPEAVDFDTVATTMARTTSEPVEMILEDVGTADVDVVGATVSDAFSLSGVQESAGSWTFNVWFAPERVGLAEDTIRVHTT